MITWTKITDIHTLPPLNTEVLIYFQGLGPLVAKRRQRPRGRNVYTETWDGNEVLPEATHWTEITQP